MHTGKGESYLTRRGAGGGGKKKKGAFPIAVPLILSLTLAGCFTARPADRELLQKQRLGETGDEFGKALPELREDSGLAEYVEFAVLNSPRVRAAYHDWEAAVSAIVPARYLPDLRLAFEAELSGMADDMYMAGGTLSVPAPGKRGLRAERLAIAAERKEAALRESALAAAFAVRRTAYRIWLVEEEITYLAETLEILDDMETALRGALAVDRASQADLLDIRIKRENLLNEIEDRREILDVYRKRFASALGVAELELFPAELPFAGDAPGRDIWETAVERSPRLADGRLAVEQAETLVKLAYRDYRPDFGVSFMRTVFSAMTVNKPMLMLSVPWRGRVRSEVETALSRAEMAEAGYLAEELDTAVLLAEGLFRWRQADREASLYGEKLLPKAEAMLEINLARYAADRAGLGDVLDSAARLLEFRYSMSAARALREIAFNEIYLVIAGVMPGGGEGFETDYE